MTSDMSNYAPGTEHDPDPRAPWNEVEPVECPECMGRGNVLTETSPTGSRSWREPCLRCEGTGYITALSVTDYFCVCPMLRLYCTLLNDGFDDTHRQRLRPYLARTIGTAGDGLTEQRSWLATDWLIRVHTPTWLDLVHLDKAAARLRVLPPVYSRRSVDAARDAAWDAAWDTARLVRAGEIRNADRATAGVAWDAAWRAAAVGYAAWRAAAVGCDRADARDAAWAAARDAARATAWAATAWADARDAARVAARDALALVVTELRASALDLLDRAISSGLPPIRW